MPFMPQRTGPPQRQNPMRIVQEIMMMKMQQNQAKKLRDEQWKQQQQKTKENQQFQMLKLEKVHEYSRMSEAEESVYKDTIKRMKNETKMNEYLAKQQKVLDDIQAEKKDKTDQENIVKGSLAKKLQSGERLTDQEMTFLIGKRPAVPKGPQSFAPSLKGFESDYVQGTLPPEQKSNLEALWKAKRPQRAPGLENLRNMQADKIMQGMTKTDQEMYDKFNKLSGGWVAKFGRKMRGEREPWNPNLKFDQTPRGPSQSQQINPNIWEQPDQY